jgi:hypothetical protein
MMNESATTGPIAGSDIEQRSHSLRRAAYLTAAVGIAHALLFLLAYWLGSSGPGAGSPDAEFIEFYSSVGRRRLTLISLYLMPFAGIAFIWFIVALRMWVSGQVRRENLLLSNIQLVSGILFIGMFFAAAAAYSAMAASIEFAGGRIDTVAARNFPLYGSALLFVFAMRMAAMFVFTTSSIGRSAGILPRWFTYAGYAVGLFLLLSATFSRALVLVFPVWVLVLCTLLLLRARHIPDDATLPGRGGQMESSR